MFMHGTSKCIKTKLNLTLPGQILRDEQRIKKNLQMIFFFKTENSDIPLS